MNTQETTFYEELQKGKLLSKVRWGGKSWFSVFSIDRKALRGSTTTKIINNNRLANPDAYTATTCKFYFVLR